MGSCICTECGHEMVLTSRPMIEEYRGEKFTVENIVRLECSNCGSYEIDLEMADKLNMDLLRQYDERTKVGRP